MMNLTISLLKLDRGSIRSSSVQVLIALSQPLVAGGDLDVPHTLLALHVAAPVELALAPLCPPLPPRGVAPVAAQQVAAIDPLGSL